MCIIYLYIDAQHSLFLHDLRRRPCKRLEQRLHIDLSRGGGNLTSSWSAFCSPRRDPFVTETRVRLFFFFIFYIIYDVTDDGVAERAAYQLSNHHFLFSFFFLRINKISGEESKDNEMTKNNRRPVSDLPDRFTTITLNLLYRISTLNCVPFLFVFFYSETLKKKEMDDPFLEKNQQKITVATFSRGSWETLFWKGKCRRRCACQSVYMYINGRSAVGLEFQPDFLFLFVENSSEGPAALFWAPLACLCHLMTRHYDIYREESEPDHQQRLA